MGKVSIVYWSGTGNTEAMADAMAEGAKDAGAEVELLTVDKADAAALSETKAFALGCPAMGAEELEEGEMEPFMAELDSQIAGKTIALFGSYGWGGGEWMDIWKRDNAGLNIVDTVICQDAPDDDALAACRAAADKLA
jgi:flavodoxin I